ncbi:glycosyltransferase family 2 protein [Paenibacillus sp. H1-7]|uniref:glycosyltransferase family 2 protein n=1 Tax=Paenibacillus sp. H1-7 TaxID=2282849 RepID=UPI001EF8DB21|nr:glycosyltransferase family 2 protein [Paenibacillus sp. H1-7]
MNHNIIISVATVINNDSSIIQSYINETLKILANNFTNYELVIIDNGSVDNSAIIIKELQSNYSNIRLISLSKKYDEEFATAAALDNCIGDAVVLMDTNYDPPSLIPLLIEKCLAGYDLVIAERNNRDDESFLEKISAKMFYKISSLLTGYNINPNYSDYVVFSRKMVNSLVQIRDRSRYLKYLKLEVGYKHTTVKYNRILRAGKRKKRNLLYSASFALEVICTNSDKLLRIASFTGLFTSFLNLMYVVYVLLIALFKKDVAEGWTSSSLFSSVMFFLMFMIMTVISFYISSVLRETKKGPLYYITDETNSSVIYKNIDKKNVV